MNWKNHICVFLMACSSIFCNQLLAQGSTELLIYQNQFGWRIYLMPFNPFELDDYSAPDNIVQSLMNSNVLLMQASVVESKWLSNASNCPSIEPESVKKFLKPEVLDSLENEMIQLGIPDRISPVLFSRPLYLEWFLLRSWIDYKAHEVELALHDMAYMNDIATVGLLPYCERFDYIKDLSNSEMIEPVTWLVENEAIVPNHFNELNSLLRSNNQDEACLLELKRLGHGTFKSRFQDAVLTWRASLSQFNDKHVFMPIDFRYLCSTSPLIEQIELLGYTAIDD